jgi:hypothetical protein
MIVTGIPRLGNLSGVVAVAVIVVIAVHPNMEHTSSSLDLFSDERRVFAAQSLDQSFGIANEEVLVGVRRTTLFT